MRPPRIRSHHSEGSRLPPITLLAFWQIRQTWFLLLMTGVSITIAVMLACTLPLYSRVAETAGLRNVLSPPSETANLTIHASMNAMSSNIVNGVDELMKIFTSESFGNSIQSSPQFSIQLDGFYVVRKHFEATSRAKFEPACCWHISGR